MPGPRLGPRPAPAAVPSPLPIAPLAAPLRCLMSRKCALRWMWPVSMQRASSFWVLAYLSRPRGGVLAARPCRSTVMHLVEHRSGARCRAQAPRVSDSFSPFPVPDVVSHQTPSGMYMVLDLRGGVMNWEREGTDAPHHCNTVTSCFRLWMQISLTLGL